MPFLWRDEPDQKRQELPKQVYLCKECGKRFSSTQLANRTYSPKVIAAAISAYNLGNTLEAAAKSANSPKAHLRFFQAKFERL